MTLTPELLELKSRVMQALQMGASLGRIEKYLAQVGAGPQPKGVSPEAHLLATIESLASGEMKAETKVDEPPTNEPVVDEPPTVVTLEELEPEGSDDKPKKKKR